MNLLVRYLAAGFCMFLWIFGIIVAKGFFSTWAALIPFWAWYLSIEHFSKMFGWL